MAADKPEVNTCYLERGIARLLKVLPGLLDEKLQRLYPHLRTGCQLVLNYMFRNVVLNRKRKYGGSKKGYGCRKTGTNYIPIHG